MACAVWESDWSEAAAVWSEASSWDEPAPADRSAPRAEEAFWTFPMSVMTASSWLRPPLSRHETVWALHDGGEDGAAADTDADADALPAAAVAAVPMLPHPAVTAMAAAASAINGGTCDSSCSLPLTLTDR